MPGINFFTLILSTIGGVLLALGMAMAILLDMPVPGAVVGIVGAALLLSILPAARELQKRRTKK